MNSVYFGVSFKRKQGSQGLEAIVSCVMQGIEHQFVIVSVTRSNVSQRQHHCGSCSAVRTMQMKLEPKQASVSTLKGGCINLDS